MGRRNAEAISWQVFWWLIVPVTAIVILFFMVQDVVPSYRAAFGSGEPGVFTAREKDCGKGGCQWKGEFVSDDGSIVRKNIRMNGSGAEKPGDKVKAKDTGDRVLVYPRGWSWDWLWVTVFLAVAVTVLFFWTRSLVRTLRRRRAARWHGPDPGVRP